MVFFMAFLNKCASFGRVFGDGKNKLGNDCLDLGLSKSFQ
jgi:hypothetical protein